MNLNKRTIESLPPLPEKETIYYKLYRDDKLAGFCLRLASTGTKTFIIDKKVHGKLVRLNIGRYGELTAEQARKEAQKLLGQLASGRQPAEERKQEKQAKITLKQAFEDYLNSRKTLKTNTQYEYKNLINLHFADWQNLPLNKITKDMVIKHHADIGSRSPSSANYAFRVISAVFNFAIAKYDNNGHENLIKENPVLGLSRTRAWYPNKRRRTKIETDQLSAWFHAVNDLRDLNKSSVANSVKHYLLLLLFSGLRKEEALPLIWAEFKNEDKEIGKTEHILDLKRKTIYIPDPKNRQEHWLPLSDYLSELFEAHRKTNSSKYVFPNATGDSCFKEPRKTMNLITVQTGVLFTLHDLRRTFATIAESVDISAYALKRLLNHKLISSDVTAGYIVTDIDRLIVPMQKITDRIIELVLRKTTETS